MATITKEALLEATEVTLHGLSCTKTVSSQEWALTQNQILEDGPDDTLDKAGHVLSCALALFEATDKVEKAKQTTGLCAALWFAHLRVRRLLMRSGDLANDLQGQLDTLRQGADDMSKMVAAKNAQLDTSMTELAKLRVQLDERTAELVKMQAHLKEADSDLGAEKGKNIDLAERITDLQQQLSDSELVEARQVNKQAKLQGELQSLTENKCTLEKQIGSFHEARAAAEKKMNALCAELGQCKQALSDMSEEKNMFEQGIQGWRVKCMELEDECKLSRDEILRCQAEHGKCVESGEQREQRIQILIAELEQNKSRVQTLMSENNNLQSQVVQLPALKLQIQELSQKSDVLSNLVPPRGELQYRQPFSWEIQRPSTSHLGEPTTERGFDSPSVTVPPRGELQQRQPFPWGGTKPTQSYFNEPATLSTLTSTTMTYSLWNSRTSTSANSAGFLPTSAQEKNARTGAVWAADLERLQATGMAMGEPAQNSNALAAPAEGTTGKNSALAPSQINRGSKYKTISHPDSSEDECEIPLSSRRKNRSRNVPLTWNTMEDFSEIRQIQKLLTHYSRESKASIHTHLNLYEKIMRSFGIDSTVKKMKYLPWTFANSEQNFFLSLDLNDFDTWTDFKKAVLKQYSPYRNDQEALRYALNMTCFPNQNPRDFLHVLKNAFSQAYQEVDTDSVAFKNTFFHGLPQATKTQLALNYDGTQDLKWILAQAQRIFEVSKISEPREGKQKSSGAKNVSEIDKASELSLEAGAKKGNDDSSKNKNAQRNVKAGNSGDKSGSDTSGRGKQKPDFPVSKNYRGDRPIANFQYRQNDRGRNNSGNSGNERFVQNREPTGARQDEQRNWAHRNEQREWVQQVEQRNWDRQRDRSPPTGREREQQSSRLETIEHQVKYLADAMGGFLRAQAQSENRTQRNQTQEVPENVNE